MKIDVYNTKGKIVGDVTLDPVVFDGTVNVALLKQSSVAYLSNQRLGLAATKTRGKVSGGGKKPWRQKGTGRARVGSIRSPLWRGGGTMFGPQPHSFHKDLPRKMKLLALKSALNAKANDQSIVILDEFKLDNSKTKTFFTVLKSLDVSSKRVTVVVGEMNEALKRSARNVQKVAVLTAKGLHSLGALNCAKIVFTKDALAAVQERIKKILS